MVSRLLLFMLLTLCSAANRAADIVATLDRNPVAVNESFTVTFEAQGRVEDDPDFTPLETYFEILNQSQSSRVQIINGSMDSTRQWQLVLMPREPGNYTLPAIEFGKDRSNPLELQVRDVPAAQARSDSTLFLEAELTPESGYVQAQLVYTVRLYRSVNLRSASLSEPTFSGVETIAEKLGEDRTFETQRNGVSYVVVERSYALFPQHSGTLVVEPVVFQGQLITRSSRFLFDENVQSKRLKSDSFSIEIRPKPDLAPTPWLPARALRLQEEWAENPPRFRVGEPLTRTLTLGVDGVAAAQLPSLARPLPDGLKQYPDQAVVQDDKRSNGLFGIRQEKIAIMPTRPGRYELPAIEIAWWNVGTGQAETALIPARTIEVAAANGEPPAPASSFPVPAAVNAAAPIATRVAGESAGFWPWLSGILALGWLITAVLWWRLGRTPEAVITARAHAGDFNAVKKACRQNDKHACKTALLGWVRCQWPEQPPTSLGALATRVDEEFASAIADLNRALYGGDDSDWNGSELLTAAQRWLKESRGSHSVTPAALAPLRPG